MCAVHCVFSGGWDQSARRATARGKGRLWLLPKRWVVERSFAWASRFRRRVRDYERLPQTLADIHFIVFAFLMLPSGTQHIGMCITPSRQRRGYRNNTSRFFSSSGYKLLTFFITAYSASRNLRRLSRAIVDNSS